MWIMGLSSTDFIANTYGAVSPGMGLILWKIMSSSAEPLSPGLKNSES